VPRWAVAQLSNTPASAGPCGVRYAAVAVGKPLVEARTTCMRSTAGRPSSFVELVGEEELACGGTLWARAGSVTTASARFTYRLSGGRNAAV